MLEVAANLLENIVSFVFAFSSEASPGDDAFDVIVGDSQVGDEGGPAGDCAGLHVADLQTHPGHRQGGGAVADPQVRLPGVAAAVGPAFPDPLGHGLGQGPWPESGKPFIQGLVACRLRRQDEIATNFVHGLANRLASEQRVTEEQRVQAPDPGADAAQPPHGLHLRAMRVPVGRQGLVA